MAKKQRSAKQRAATRKLVALNRRKAKPKRRRSTPIKRRIKRARRRVSKAIKTIKRRRGSKSMVKLPAIPPVVKKVATGIGLASIGVTILTVVAPSVAQNQIVKPALAFLGGGIPAAIVQFLLQGGTSFLGGNGGNADRGGAA